MDKIIDLDKKLTIDEVGKYNTFIAYGVKYSAKEDIIIFGYYYTIFFVEVKLNPCSCEYECMLTVKAYDNSRVIEFSNPIKSLKIAWRHL